MEKIDTPTFVLELPLKVTPAQEHALLVRMDIARQIYNACLGESLKRLRQMRQSKIYQKAKVISKGTERNQLFSKARQVNGFREYDLHAYAKRFNNSWLGEHVDSSTTQKIATRAFNAVMMYAVGKRGKPRFKGKYQLISVEGKSNKTGIRWRDGYVLWKGLTIPVIIDEWDPVIRHGLDAPVKYVRISMRNIGTKKRFYAQLICEGKPYQKEKNTIGKGRVGLDLGPSTIAVVSESGTQISQFCAELADAKREIRTLQRKLDRQRRANNPQNYNEDGTETGANIWHKSNGYVESQRKIADIQRKAAAYRTSLHGRMVNDILRMGDIIQFEKLSYFGFQRQYGKSVGMRAPGMFISLLKRKAESAGVSINEFDPRSPKLSQICHGCGTYTKKPLSQRWHHCGCGIAAQRDLYSAFLAMCMEGATLNAGLAEKLWPGVDTHLQAAMSEIQSVNGRRLPASFGLNQRQNRSSAISGKAVSETRDVVPVQGEPVGACFSSRTPCL